MQEFPPPDRTIPVFFDEDWVWELKAAVRELPPRQTGRFASRSNVTGVPLPRRCLEAMS